MKDDTDVSTLYVVATPIGNLGDMSPRALEILQQVDVILAEDTRDSRKLLDHFGIDATLASYHDHTSPKRTDALLERLAAGGASMALISDAGTPTLSDPGYRLIAGAHARGVAVRAVPGASAVTAAISVSGLPVQRFVFEGFLPARAPARRRRLEDLRSEVRTVLFFEAPHRLLSCLEDMVEILGGGRPAALVREISKRHETVVRATLTHLRSRVVADANQRRGEIALLVGPDTCAEADKETDRRLLRLLLEELPPAKAAALAARFLDRPKRQFYNEALRIASESGR